MSSMVLQHSRIFLALIAGVTFLLTLSSVRVLSDLISAHHTASSVIEGTQSGEWGHLIGQTEANIGSHIPQVLHRGKVIPSRGAHSPLIFSTCLKYLPFSLVDSFMHNIERHSRCKHRDKVLCMKCNTRNSSLQQKTTEFS